MNLLEIKNLHVQYKTDDGIVYALNGIDLEVGQSETLALVGETGAGKTTTALSVLKLLPDRVGKVTKGSILLNGKEITAMSEHDMEKIRGNQISMIFQDPMTSLNPLIPVGKQIEEALLLHTQLGAEAREKRVDEILEQVSLSPSRKYDYPHQFSGGMRQRIVIAIALACNPELLLADEPTTALDVTIQAQVLAMMNELKKTYHASIILITHDLGVVAQTCDKVAIMYAGRIVEKGTVQDIFESDKHHPYTEGLFGSIPELNKDAKRLHAIPGLMPDPMIQHKGCSFYDRCPVRKDACQHGIPGGCVEGTHAIYCYQFTDESADRG